MRLATTEELRSIARKAFVRATGMCYNYRNAWTDKDKSFPHLRYVGFYVSSDKGDMIVEIMHEMLDRKNLCVMALKYTESGYIRCKAVLNK